MRAMGFVMALALVFIAGAALAEVKWEQYPDPDGNAWLSELDICPNGWTAELADDFECLDGDPITAVEWWGTDGTAHGTGSLPDHYLIRFYSDVPAGVDMPWSHPGDLLYDEQCWDFTAEWDPSLEQWHFYQDLAVPFCQEAGDTLWFSVIGVVCTDDDEGAAWCDCYTVPQWNDEAVIRSDFLGYPEWTAMSEYASGYWGPREFSFVLHGSSSNVVCDPDPEYLTVANPTQTVAVKYLGCGDGLLYGYSIKFAWDGAIVGTSAASVTEGDLLSSEGTTFFFAADTGTNEITIDCALLGDELGVTGPGTMFTIEFTGLAVGTSDIDITILEARDADNNSLTGFTEDDGLLIVDVSPPTVTDVLIWNDTLAHTDDYIKNGDTARVTATVLDDDPAFDIPNIRANLVGLGGGAADPPTTYNSLTGAAVWTSTITAVTCTPSDGTVTVTVSAVDPIGNPATPGSDTIIADNTPPTAALDFNASPGHEKCDLSWTLGTDLYLDGTVIQRNDNAGEYPTYSLFVGAWPVVHAYYPPNHSSGTNAFTGAGTTASDGVVPRNIYYYQAFCYDIARNYGAAATTARDLATNYYLGDVTTTLGFWDGYNGYVNDADIDKLGGTYYVIAPIWPHNQCDVGPTVHPDGHRFGLPVPDAWVEFEDLMIFAMNFGVVAPRVVPFLPDEATKALSLELAELGATEDGLFEVALRLEGNASEVKGLSTVIAYGSSDLEFVNARLSDDMSSPLAPVFFWHGSGGGTVQVDMAVLGTDVTVGGSGDVAILTFRIVSDDYTLEFSSADLRGGNNEHLSAELEGMEWRSEIPTAFRLVGNLPNPFNPVTKVAYQVPHESHVSIRVYDVSGRLVRTLVDQVIEPGRHEAVWNGRNDRGESVGSGVYFCTMDAGDFHGSHKMMLLK